MLITSIVIALFFLGLIINNYYKCWRKTILSIAIILGILLVIITEFLSWLRLLYFFPVMSFWILLNFGLILVYLQKIANKPVFNFYLSTQLFSKALSPFLLLLVLGIVSTTLIVGLIGLVAPPNTWDSMTYHMSRVVHWIQNGSVAHYPTYNLPQLFHPPFAEFAIMHLQILSGGDRFANMVQWFSMISSIIGVSLIAKELNASIRGQVFAAVFCATIPMGILQASSTQNDYVVSFWLVCLAYYILLVIKTKNQPDLLFFIGASLGLALLTKSSGYLYAFPFMVWFGLVQIRRWHWQSWQPILLTTTIAILLNLNHYLRNLDLFGSVIGTPENFSVEYKIEVISLPTFLSNLFRNLALHLDIVRNLGLQNFITPITGIANKLLLMFHSAIGVNMYDPRITAAYSGVPGLSFDENIAGNPLHFFVILGLLFYCLLQKKLRKNNLLLIYFLTIISGFLLLCLLLKIQSYQSRHHLSAFLLFSAVVGVSLSQIPLRKVANSLAILLIVASLPWVFQNKFRPIAAEANIFNLSRIEQYFINRPQLQEPYVQAANFVLSTGCQHVGLSLGKGISVGNEYWEYPFWVLFHQQTKNIRLENVEPQNVSLPLAQNYPHNNFTPCAIVAVRTGNEEPIEQMVVKNGHYVEKWSLPPVSVLMK